MNSPRNALALPIAFSIAVALVVVGHDAFGTRPASAPPTHVATVDIAKVFERIEANAPWEIELNALAERLNEEATRRQEAIQRQLEQSEATEDAVEKQRIRDQAALMKLELEEWAGLKQLEIDRERALMWRTMYRAIREQVTALAKADGWDLVLVNDSLGDLKISEEANVSREQQVLTQILNRRMLYASEVTDITEQLIVRINNLKR